MNNIKKVALITIAAAAVGTLGAVAAITVLSLDLVRTFTVDRY